MVRCSDCRGAKQSFGIGCNMDSGCRPITMTCRFCNGTGSVEAAAAERWHRGEALRKERVKRGDSQREQASARDISPILSTILSTDGRCSDMCEVPRWAPHRCSVRRGRVRVVFGSV